MLKRKFTERLTYIISILVIIFVVSSVSYFALMIKSDINAIRDLAVAIQNAVARESVDTHLASINGVFIMQSILFVVVVACLIAIIIHLTKLFLIQKRNALVDGLTNVYNKRAIFFGLKREMKRSERYGHALTIAILDIDHFKKYNDTNGHGRGDQALQKFAKILRQESRETDLVGRYGGEEFLIVFPETNLKDAVTICERIRAKVETTKFYGEFKLPKKNLTASIGVEEFKAKSFRKYPSYSRKIKELIDLADHKLYKGKAESRNVVKS